MPSRRVGLRRPLSARCVGQAQCDGTRGAALHGTARHGTTRHVAHTHTRARLQTSVRIALAPFSSLFDVAGFGHREELHPRSKRTAPDEADGGWDELWSSGALDAEVEAVQADESDFGPGSTPGAEVARHFFMVFV